MNLIPDVPAFVAEPSILPEAVVLKVRLAAFQYRVRPLRASEYETWSDWTSCDKTSYDEYKNRPFQHDWQFEVRTLYEKVDEQCGV